MEDLNIYNPKLKFGDLKQDYHSVFVPYSWCHNRVL